MGQCLHGPAADLSPDLTLRILLLGDSGVGKTSLMMRYSDNKFAYSLIATAGVDFKVKNMDIPNPAYRKGAKNYVENLDQLAMSGDVDDGLTREERDLRLLLSKPFLRVRCQIWDTAGQEKFHVITRAYYRGAHGIVTCFDVTDKDSFRNVDYWLANIHTHTKAHSEGGGKGVKGNTPSNTPGKRERGVKTMIVGNKIDLHDSREVSREEGEGLAKECGVRYVETSAKDGTGVIDAFKQLATDVVVQMDRERRREEGEREEEWEGGDKADKHNPGGSGKDKYDKAKKRKKSKRWSFPTAQSLTGKSFFNDKKNSANNEDSGGGSGNGSSNSNSNSSSSSSGGGGDTCTIM